MACCVKHFPGHGDTHVDSHLDLPTVDKSLGELETLELVPFRALRDEAPAIMTAHIVYPQIDPDYPATLSKKILGDILRGAWGYDGVVITDALMMKAICERYGYDRAAVLALQAGADMILAQGSLSEQATSMKALVAAFESGSVSAEQGERAASRLNKLAQKYPVQHDDYAGAMREQDDALMRAAWARGLTNLNAAKAPMLHQRVRVFTQRTVPCDGVSEAGPTGEQVAHLFGDFVQLELVQMEDINALDWTHLKDDGVFNVLASNHRARYNQVARDWRPDLHLVLWNPFQAIDVKAPTVVTWGYADGALAALRSWLSGKGEATASSPVKLRS